MNPHDASVYENSFPLEGMTFKDAGRVSNQVKKILQKMNFHKDIIRRAAVITYEAEINICSYAERGRITLQVTPQHIIIEAIDEGQGIKDIELAMQEGYSTATKNIYHMGFGAGMGLSNIKRFSDSFNITSEVGKGAHLKMVINV